MNREQRYGAAARRHFLAAAAGAALGRSGRAAPRAKPNIIVIVADDFGFADASYNGCLDYQTPHIDALAASGVRFTTGYVTHPYCSPSRAAILTGRYQQRFGHEANPPFAPEDASIGTDVREVMLPEMLRKAGYRTAAIGKWHLGSAAPLLPQARGFDEFFGFPGGGYSYYGIPNPRTPADRIVRNGRIVPPSEITYLTGDFSDEAVAFIGRNRRTPFFLYLAYNAVHTPNQAPARYLERTWHIENGLRSVYAAQAIAMDDGIGRVVEALRQNGVWNNTLVFFLSDNGGRTEGADNRPLRGHKGLLFEGGIRVPFLLSWPDRLPRGTAYPQPVSSLDIFPTALAAAGAGPPAGQPLDGVDLSPYLTGAAGGSPHDTLYWRELGGQGWAVRNRRYKLMQRSATGKIHLFDLEADPYERRDLAAERPEVARELRELYERWNKQMAAPRWTDPHAQNVKTEFEAVDRPRRAALPPAK